MCAPVTEISMVVPLVTFSSNLNRLISKSDEDTHKAFFSRLDQIGKPHLADQDFCRQT
jgi:hypothetical protein